MKTFTAFCLGLFLGMSGWLTHLFYWVLIFLLVVYHLHYFSALPTKP